MVIIVIYCPSNVHPSRVDKYLSDNQQKHPFPPSPHPTTKRVQSVRIHFLSSYCILCYEPDVRPSTPPLIEPLKSFLSNGPSNVSLAAVTLYKFIFSP